MVRKDFARDERGRSERSVELVVDVAVPLSVPMSVPVSRVVVDPDEWRRIAGIVVVPGVVATDEDVEAVSLT
jgi:hypothetical protein